MQNIQSTKISSRNQTAVPLNVRKALGLKPGDHINWNVSYQQDQPIVIASTTKLSLAKSSRGLGKHIWHKISIESYVNQLRNEWQKQD